MALAAAKVEEEPWQENLNMHLICPDCKEVPPKLIEEFSSGDMVCGDCGLVLGARIVDTRSEWRTFSNDDQTTDDPSRVGDGPNVLLNGDQLATSIAFDAGSKGARDLTRAQNRSTADKGNRVLLAAYKEITAMADANNMTKTVADHAKHLFKMTADANLFRGKSQEAVIAGCIFIACRQCKVARTFREVFAMTKVSKKEIGRIYKALENFFKEQNNQREANHEDIGPTASTSAAELCIRYCSQLDLGAPITKVARAIAEKMGTIDGLAGRSPLSAAAACIYFASHLLDDPRSAKDIGGIVGVSDGTIRTSYKFLEAKKDELIDPAWLGEGKGDVKRLPKP